MTALIVATDRLAARDEHPARAPGKEPHWAEAYLFVSYDVDTGVGMWLHFHTTPFNRNLWQDVLFVYLPGDEVLVARGHGRRRSSRGPTGSFSSAMYDEDTGRWHIDVEAAVHRYRESELYHGPAPERTAEGFRAQLVSEPTAPALDLTAHMGAEVWADDHWEQQLRYDGWVEIQGERRAVAPQGVRDHSRGARKFSDDMTFNYHWWMHGWFPSGKGFGLVRVVDDSGRFSLDQAYLYENGDLHEQDVQIVELPRIVPDLDDMRRVDDPFCLVLAGPDAPAHEIEGQIVHEVPFSLAYPNDIVPGVDFTLTRWAEFEGITRFVWDGEVGFGISERTLRRDSRITP